MSYGQSNPYGGNDRYGEDNYTSPNPYGSSGGYTAQNPYGSSSTPYGSSSNPYGGESAEYGSSDPYPQTQPYGQGDTYLAHTGHQDLAAQPQSYQTPSPGYAAPSNYSRPAGYAAQTQTMPPTMPQPTYDTTQPAMPESGVLSNADFLVRVDGVNAEIRELTANVREIGTIHQRVLVSPDNASSAQLQNLIAETQILNTRIKDQIKQLEMDAVKTGRTQKNNQTKDSQIRTLKSNFKTQLDGYQKEEVEYSQRYKEQIARQYRIVNPDATNEEVQQATDADWGDEGVFQTALKSNRTGAANSVLGAVRARHNDIVQINKTLLELNQLFQDLAEAVVIQEAPIIRTEEQTHKVLADTERGNVELTGAVKSAGNARRNKWICFWIVLIIIIILAIVLGVVFGRPGHH